MQTVDYRHLPLRPGDRLLDLGCGEGRHVIFAYAQTPVHAVGVDLDFDELLATSEKFRDWEQPWHPQRSFSLAAATALCLPFADDSFDRVICSEVLEHIPDYRAALAEIRRVLRPGGLLCTSVPRRWPERVCWALSEDYHRVPGGHVRIFRDAELCEQIEQLGFRCYRRHWAHALHSPYWWLQCLLWSRRERSRLLRLYHRLLVWDLMARPWLTRTLERLLNPLLGKSVVRYFRCEAA